jgi:hypothetical protein
MNLPMTLRCPKFVYSSPRLTQRTLALEQQDEGCGCGDPTCVGLRILLTLLIAGHIAGLSVTRMCCFPTGVHVHHLFEPLTEAGPAPPS